MMGGQRRGALLPRCTELCGTSYGVQTITNRQGSLLSLWVMDWLWPDDNQANKLTGRPKSGPWPGEDPATPLELVDVPQFDHPAIPSSLMHQ